MGDFQDTAYGPIPSEWRFVPASEYCLKVTDGTHDSPKPQVVGMPLVTSKHIKGRSIDFESAYLISKQDYDKINQRSAVHQWDVIISMIGAYCGFTYVERNSDIGYAVKNVGMFKTGDSLKALWLDYFLKSNVGQNILEQVKGGTSQPYIALGALRSLPVLVPTKSEQETIVTLLGSLDAKIDLLHRQNRTLEAMAETLFRQWFVEEAEEGWEEGTLDQILSVKGGTTPSTKNPEFWDGDIHWTTPRDLSSSADLFLFDTSRRITERGLAEIGSGLLPSGTLLMSSRAPVGYLAFADMPVAVNQGYIAIIHDKGIGKHFIYLWLKANMDLVHSYANGSTFQEISKSAFKTLELTIAPMQRVADFEKVVQPLFGKIRANLLQVRKLSSLRDTLLPKLMSGEVRVNESTSANA